MGASFISVFQPAESFSGLSLKWRKVCGVQNALRDGWTQGIPCTAQFWDSPWSGQAQNQ